MMLIKFVHVIFDSHLKGKFLYLLIPSSSLIKQLHLKCGNAQNKTSPFSITQPSLDLNQSQSVDRENYTFLTNKLRKKSSIIPSNRQEARDPNPIRLRTISFRVFSINLNKKTETNLVTLFFETHRERENAYRPYLGNLLFFSTGI